MSFRAKIRSLHRDIGYLIIGFTIIYAISGIAVNHIGEWDANFSHYEKNLVVPDHIDIDVPNATEKILSHLDISSSPVDIFDSEHELEILLPLQEIVIDKESNRITVRGKNPRPFLRTVNWLHLNRGKRAWTILADAYAGLLLFVALTGLIMIPDKKRRWIAKYTWVMFGIAIPIVYLYFSGGP